MIADPVGTLERTYTDLGMAWPPTLAGSIADHVATRPKDARGAHEYSLAEMGLDPATERARFRRYQDHYQVPDEV